MNVVAIVLSILLILEFAFAPVNLWRGRTIGNFVRFTGFAPKIAKTWFAPAKLAAASLLIAGLAFRELSLAGSALALAISAIYLVRLLAPTRRDAAGLLGFAIFGLLAAALLVVRIIET